MSTIDVETLTNKKIEEMCKELDKMKQEVKKIEREAEELNQRFVLAIQNI